MRRVSVKRSTIFLVAPSLFSKNLGRGVTNTDTNTNDLQGIYLDLYVTGIALQVSIKTRLS